MKFDKLKQNLKKKKKKNVVTMFNFDNIVLQ